MPRELPHNNEAEQSIIGALLVYPAVATVVRDEGLESEDFYYEVHRHIYDAMLDLLEANKPIEPQLLITRLNDKNELNAAGGADYILQLADAAVSGESAKYYIDIIHSKSDQRKLINVTQQLAEKGFDEAEDVDTLLDEAEKNILEVTRVRRGLTNFRSGGEIANGVVDELDTIRNSKLDITGIRTGFKDLDDVTNGLQRGDLIILAARPSVGKTAFALNIALNAAKRANNQPGNTVAVFSLEMPGEQLLRRMLSSLSSVPGEKLRNGKLNDVEFAKVTSMANVMKTYQLYIDDSPSSKIAEIFSKCRKLKTEHGLDLIVIDYLQLISGSSRRNADNRQQEVSDISRSLKALARELEVPVIALSQLSRSIESRSDRTPQLSDLRESGSIEQDADIVMFLSRDDYQKSETETSNDDSTVILSIKKHRNGALRDINLSFDKDISRFVSIAMNRE